MMMMMMIVVFIMEWLLQMHYANCKTLLADLGKCTSWLNMYTMTAKACEAIQPLPHNFAMPKVEPHPSDQKLARIHWQQRGSDVVARTKHLKQWNKTRSLSR